MKIHAYYNLLSFNILNSLPNSEISQNSENIPCNTFYDRVAYSI